MTAASVTMVSASDDRCYKSIPVMACLLAVSVSQLNSVVFGMSRHHCSVWPSFVICQRDMHIDGSVSELVLLWSAAATASDSSRVR